jgi:hypothetical protein
MPKRSGKDAQSDSAAITETGTKSPAKARKTRAAKQPSAQGAQRPEHPCYEGLRRQMDDLLAQTDGTPDSGKMQALSDLWPTFAQHHLALIRALDGIDGSPDVDEVSDQATLVRMLLDQRATSAAHAARSGLALTMIREFLDREDAPDTGLLALARKAGIGDDILNRRLAACIDGSADRSMRKRQPTADQEDDMPRYDDMPERDERGRFTSDDDNGRGSGGGRGRAMSGRGYDDDDRRSSRGVRDDDDRRGSYGNRDDDDRRASSRARDDNDGRGWHGDREGHAEAARRGWDSRDDDRGGGRSGYRSRDDDDRRSSASRGRDDDDRRSGSSRGRDDGDGRGWFGDREGHAEAARRGWDNRDDDVRRSSGSRDRYDDDRRSTASRSRNDDDDRRSSGSSRGGRDDSQGGWFGDREGHSEASRRGWENRRNDDDDRGQGRGRR